MFDLELGVPTASKALPGSRSPFASLLGAYGEGVTAGVGDDGGTDFIYCAHQVWAGGKGGEGAGRCNVPLTCKVQYSVQLHNGGTPPLPPRAPPRTHQNLGGGGGFWSR